MLVRYLSERQIVAGSSRAFDFEIIAVIVMKLLKRFNEQVIDRHPDRSAPIRIPAENTGLRFSRLIANHFLLSANQQRVRVIFMIHADRENAVIAQKLVWVEHTAQQTFHSMTAGKR